MDARPAGQHQGNGQDFQTEAGRAGIGRGARRDFLAGAAGMFRNGNKGAGLVVPDGAVNEVHGVLSRVLQKFGCSRSRDRPGCFDTGFKSI